LHHILTTRTEPWVVIKSSILVHMDVSHHLSFYFRHSVRGYMVGTTAGFLVEIMEALALQYHHQILWKCPQYHMSTCPTHCRVTGSGHPLHGGLGGYYWGNIPQVPRAAGYGPKLWIRSMPSSGKWLGNHRPHTRKQSHHSKLKRRGHLSAHLTSLIDLG
jgi:hypothetical protein